MQTTGTVTSADQNRALALSTIAFTACFAVWTIFSIIGVAIKSELGLNDTPVRPAGGNTDPDRFAHADVSGRLDREIRRTPGLFSADDPGCAGHLGC